MQFYDNDDDHNELGPSRSQQKREALEVLDLAERLVGLKQSDLEKMPLEDQIRSAVDDTRKIKSHIAHKRQLHYLAKLMRRMDDESLQAIRDALDIPAEQQRAATKKLHKLEQWRERLLHEGDEALNVFVQEFGKADRTRLRQLIRRAQEERKANKAPAAFRELFVVIREAVERDNGSTNEASDDVDGEDQA